jgi:hypothetical protein
MSAARPQPAKRATSTNESESDEGGKERHTTPSRSRGHRREKSDRTLLSDNGSSEEELYRTPPSHQPERSPAAASRRHASRTTVSNPISSAKRGHKSVTEEDRRATPYPRTKSAVRFANLTPDEQSSESDGELYLPSSQNKRYLKPPTYNGSTNFETFYARFENCAKYNNWNRSEQLAHLRNALVDEAGQVLWDSGPEITNSLRQLTNLLKERFGGAAQSEKFKMELRSRLRQPRETLSDLYRDIKRLMTLGYPDLDQKAREVIAVDRFVDSLGDAELALKIRERTPTTLDEALRAGLRQEVWNKDVARFRSEEHSKPKAVRTVGDDLL